MKLEYELKNLSKLKMQLRNLRLARVVYFGDMDKKGAKIESLMKKERQEKIRSLHCKIKAYEYIVDLIEETDLGDEAGFDESFENLLEAFEHERKAADYHLRIAKLEDNSREKRKGKA